MKNRIFPSATALIAVLVMSTMLAVTAKAQSAGSAAGSHAGSHAGHKDMAAPPADAEPKAEAVINKVDAASGMLNITHEPIPAIGWPKMTMDLPVTSRVDLSKVKEGDKVTVTIKLGRDKKYRVTEIEPAK